MAFAQDFQDVLDSLPGDWTDIEFVHVDASEQFLSALAGVSDPERKRKIIGRVFIEVFDAAAAGVWHHGRAGETMSAGGTASDIIEALRTTRP